MERALHDVAARYGMRVRSFVVPTGLFVRVGGGPDGRGGDDAIELATGAALSGIARLAGALTILAWTVWWAR